MSINRSHGKNKDKYLDRNGANECSAADLRIVLDNYPQTVSWGDILGNLNNQSDLKTILDEKQVILPESDVESKIILPLDNSLKDLTQTQAPTLELGANFTTIESKFNTYSVALPGQSSNAHISMPYHSDFEIFNNTGDWTFEGWFKFDSLNYTSIQGIFGLAEDWLAPYDGWMLERSTSQLNFKWYNDDNGEEGKMVTPSGTIINDVWYHLALIKKGTEYALFVNGLQRSHAVIPWNKQYSNGTFRIGNNNLGPGGGMRGWMENFRVTNSDIYQSDFNPVYPFTSYIDIPTESFANYISPGGYVTVVNDIGETIRSNSKQDQLEASVNGISPRFTTEQRDIYAQAINGAIIYNTTLNKFQGFENGVWVNLI